MAYNSVIALSKLYSLNDARLAQTMVKGDLIITNSNKIMTRSRAKLSKLRRIMKEDKSTDEEGG
jgi:hypothetical protein